MNNMSENFNVLESKLMLLEKALKEEKFNKEISTDILYFVEEALQKGEILPPTLSHKYLDITRYPKFLLSLPDREHRYRWAETTFKIIKESNYTLENMLDQRVQSHPEKILFKEYGAKGWIDWTYGQIKKNIRAIASLFLSIEKTPRVAILSENSVGSACCDLACLTHGIFVTPLNIHFTGKVLAEIFNQLSINIVVIDSEELKSVIQEVNTITKKTFHMFTFDSMLAGQDSSIRFLPRECSQLSAQDIESRLSQIKKDVMQVCTAMYTSGSTGLPKGVLFTIYNLVTKRFARAAALPKVGENETFVTYLPLFHTFGRYLELMGTLFWGGTYVFVGNPSSEALIARIQEIEPTGMISIPLRWIQIRDYCLEKMKGVTSRSLQEKIFREVAGKRLYWGLSAAGYLDPKVFKFFQSFGVDLCSGFGMTETTGGITMTPPGEYLEDTVGIPLPGARIRLSDVGELQVSGPYVARYLEETEIGGQVDSLNEEYWLPTGDIFHIHPKGYLQIVDRIKDIYKNSKGQTIAPKIVEKQFVDVPGIKSSFLLGDGRDYNVLLIVPDKNDAVIKDSPSDEHTREYFHRIVLEANKNLAPYERVINFAILEREFDIEKKEITPKGSFNRKAIEKNFEEFICKLYESDFIELEYKNIKFQLPRWIFRDLGILETDIIVDGENLYNKRFKTTLFIRINKNQHRVQIGDLEYIISSNTVDLGIFARQPRLWAGNIKLLKFLPCKEGWDVPIEGISHKVFLPEEKPLYPLDFEFKFPFIRDKDLAKINEYCTHAMFFPKEKAIAALRELEIYLANSNNRLRSVIERRLETLAYHKDYEIRATAYRILLLDEPEAEYSELLPTFIHAGLPFLSEESIRIISSRNLEKPRLAAFRKRLHYYRTELSWPASPVTQEQFINIFKLLSGFAKFHPEYYSTVRAMLVSWAMHRVDSKLALAAEESLSDLNGWFSENIYKESIPSIEYECKFVFADDLIESEIEKIKEVLIKKFFIKESLMYAFEEKNFEMDMVPPGGIWVSRISSYEEKSSYKVSINTQTGKHFDLQLIFIKDMKNAKDTIFWTIALNDYPYDLPVMPSLGAFRSDVNAFSIAYINDLTVWQKIEEISSRTETEDEGLRWKRLFTRSIAAFFTAWRNSSFKIVPGVISPTNVLVPEPDFRESSFVLSLLGWKEYKGPLSLIIPIIKNFYIQIVSHYPWCSKKIKLEWIFDACREALGNHALEFLNKLRDALKKETIPVYQEEFSRKLEDYIEQIPGRFYVKLSLQCAVERYKKWLRLNPGAFPEARHQATEELNTLYRLGRFEDIHRYYLYRHTYFIDHPPNVKEKFDRLLNEMSVYPEKNITQMTELSELQDTLTSSVDRIVFSQLVFPQIQGTRRLEIISVGEDERKHALLKSHIADKYGVEYTVREPIEPSELGKLYRMFLEAGLPRTISEQNRYLITLDNQNEIVGGISYKIIENNIADLDGIIVIDTLKKRGIGSAMLDDFCDRMESQNMSAAKTQFFLMDFYTPKGFELDKRWGGLVKHFKQAMQEDSL